VLGVDPGLVGTGWGLVEPAAGGAARGGSAAIVIATGVIATSADMSLPARVREIYDGLVDVLAKHEPALLVLEDLYTEYKFPRTALLMAHARGAICLAAAQRDVTVLALAPAEVKRAIAAHGAASKAQVQVGVQRMLHLAAPPRPSHIADALALALTGFSRRGGRLG
jgi:crossover junction endodeoxyribonuclease RuvC